MGVTHPFPTKSAVPFILTGACEFGIIVPSGCYVLSLELRRSYGIDLFAPWLQVPVILKPGLRKITRKHINGEIQDALSPMKRIPKTITCSIWKRRERTKLMDATQQISAQSNSVTFYTCNKIRGNRFDNIFHSKSLIRLSTSS